MKRFTKIIDDHLEEWILFILFVTAVFSIGLQVFMRFVLDSSLSWSEELARYAFIWLIYIAVPYGIKKQRHITLDVIYEVVPNHIKRYMDIVAEILVACFTILLLYYGSIVVSMISQFGQLSPALGLNMVIVYAAAPAGMLLTVIRAVQNVIHHVRDWQGTEGQNGLF